MVVVTRTNEALVAALNRVMAVLNLSNLTRNIEDAFSHLENKADNMARTLEHKFDKLAQKLMKGESALNIEGKIKD